MPNAGFGVISKTFIPKYTWLAEYEGITVLPDEKDYTSAYTWSVSIMNGIEKCTRIELKNLQEENSCDKLQQSTVADLHRQICDSVDVDLNYVNYIRSDPRSLSQISFIFMQFLGKFAHITGWLSPPLLDVILAQC